MCATEADASWEKLKDLVSGIDFFRGVPNAGTPNEAIRFEFDVEERTQTVVLRRQPGTSGGGDWVIIEAPFAEIQEVDLADVLSKVELFPCGGLGRLDTMVTLRDSLDLKAPMEHADFVLELIKTMREIANLSDVFEKHFVGGDRF